MTDPKPTLSTASPAPGSALSSGESKPTAQREGESVNRAGTLASDADDVKTYPPHFVREKVHIGNGNFKWSEPFDPAVRAREEAEAQVDRLKQRGTFPEPEPKDASEK